MWCPAAVAAPSSSDDDSDGDAPAGAGRASHDAATGLPSLFTVGQYVSCVVLNNASASDNVFTRLMAGGDPAGKQKKRGKVAVSLSPDLVNDGVTLAHVSTAGSVLWGAVASREDHGFVVDVGIAGVHAFLPFKNVATGGNGASASGALRTGMATYFTVSSVKVAANSMVLSYSAVDSGSVVPAGASKLHALTSLKPGMLVNTTVKKVWCTTGSGCTCAV